MFDDMHNISRSQQVMIKTATMECFCVRLIICSQGSVYYYIICQSQILTGFYQKIIRSSTPWIQSIMILALGLLQIFCSAQIVSEIPC